MEASANGNTKKNLDYSTLCEGENDPSLNKKIKHLLAKSRGYIVYLDDELIVRWNVGAEFPGDLCDGFGNIVNRMTGLQSQSFSIFSDNGYRKSFQHLLGESIVRLLVDQDVEMGNNILDDAQRMLEARGSESAKVWYLGSSFSIAFLAVLFALVMWIMRENFSEILGKTGFLLLFSSLLGAVGSIISIFSRLQAMPVDIFARKIIHIIEGSLRIIIGIAGAFLCAVAVKANILLGFINSSEFSLPILLTISIVSGASERFVPDLIKHVEKSFSAKNPTDQG